MDSLLLEAAYVTAWWFLYTVAILLGTRVLEQANTSLWTAVLCRNLQNVDDQKQFSFRNQNFATA